jgi:SAM-dependent methyltransferase
MTSNAYVGQELNLFAHATNWKRYWSSKIRPFLTGDVLEVGAGMGSNTALLKSQNCSSWTCLEPDPALVATMRDNIAASPGLTDCHVECGTTQTLPAHAQFDAVIYIDVLEHIQDDLGELAQASRLLRKNGKICVLSPAHSWLFTPFDRAIGHYRRYNKRTLSSLSPEGCEVVKLDYLDSAGMIASLGNKLLLHQSIPSLRQIIFWDRALVPISRILDPLTFHQVGKSLLAIWRKKN